MKEALVSFHANDSGGVKYVNTLAVRSENSGLIGPEVSLHDLLDGVDTWLWSKWMACLHPDYSAESLKCFAIDDHTSVAEKSKTGFGTLSVAGAGSTFMPKEAALVLSLRTSRGGRRYRGRMFIPSPRLGYFMSDATNWGTTVAFYTACTAFGDQILAGRDYTHGTELTPAHLSARVWSRVAGTTTDVTSYIARRQVHWLRSRSTAP